MTFQSSKPFLPGPITAQLRLAPPDWDDYVSGHPCASAYHASCWPAAFARAFNVDTYFLCSRNGSGAISGVLPLQRQRSLLFGDRLTSLAYVNYGGCIADDEPTRIALAGAAQELAVQLGADEVELRDTANYGDRWATRSDKASLRLDLPEDVETLRKQLGSKLRSQVKRGLRDSPAVQVGGRTLVNGFYDIFAAVMRDHGTPVYPRRFFEVLLDECSARCTLLLLSVNGSPAAGAFLVRWRDTLEIPWAATLASQKGSSLNMALYWQALSFAIESGCKTFDFGRSTIDSGPYRFKLQWGAKPEQLNWSVWRPDGRHTALRQGPAQSRVRSLATAAWRHLPLDVANAIGPRISPMLPW